MKSQTTSLIKKLYALFIISILFNAAANAQIVYTDVNPDPTFACSFISCNNTYALDINSDGTNDFNVSVSHNATTLGFGSKWSQVIVTFLK